MQVGEQARRRDRVGRDQRPNTGVVEKGRLIWNPGSGSIEAQNFTPWLAENLDRLSAALGIRLEHPMSLITSSCTTSPRSTSGVLAFWATLPADPVARPGDG